MILSINLSQHPLLSQYHTTSPPFMESSPELHLQNLRPIKVLGTGAMGTVFLVYDHLTDPSALEKFALKVVEKRSMQTDPNTDRRARWEVSVLDRLNRQPHRFLPSLIGSVETEEIFAWSFPFCAGGDLNVLRHRQNDGVFSAAVIQFYAAEIVCALAHLHSMGIVYRDLKPENVLVQSTGHVTLTDFDLSRDLTPKTIKFFMLSEQDITNNNNNKHHRRITRVMKKNISRVSPVTRRATSFSTGERSNSFVGTEEYVAPEMVRGDGHDFSIDWWALGILCYEMLYGTTPFRGKNRKDTFGRILTMPLKFTGKPTPLSDLITKLLDRDPTRRLGYARGACEIQEHPFFNGVQWDLLTEVERPPYIPLKDDIDVGSTSNLDGLTVTEYFQKLRQPPLLLESPSRDDCGYNVSFTEF